MVQVDSSQFARGFNDAVTALLSVYGGVRMVFRALKEDLEHPDPAPVLYDLGISPKPHVSRTNPDERFLRSWQGRFYATTRPEEEDDGEVDDEEAGNDDAGDEDTRAPKYIALTAGQGLAFVKVVFYQRDVRDFEPHVLFGFLENCRVAAGWESLKARRDAFHKVLEVINARTQPGQLRTRATVSAPPNMKKKHGTDRLIFDVCKMPEVIPLFDLDGRERLQQLAAKLKASCGTAAAPVQRS